jgi:K+-transporting ATPase KdpF subunit
MRLVDGTSIVPLASSYLFSSTLIRLSHNWKKSTMLLLFIIALGVFGYMCYVLIKPEKF